MNSKILALLFSTTLAGVVLVSLVDAAAKGFVLLGLAVVVCLGLRRASAATRHLIWFSTMGATLALPVLSLCLPQWRVLPEWMDVTRGTRGTEPFVAAFPPIPTLRVDSQTETVSHGDFVPPADQFPPMDEASEQALESLRTSGVDPSEAMNGAWAGLGVIRMLAVLGIGAILPTLLLIVWGVGAVVLLWPMVRSVRTLRRLAASLGVTTNGPAAAATGAIARELGVPTPLLYLGSAGAMPMVWGVRRGRLLLPAEAMGWDAVRLRAVLLHELAHLRRLDPLTQAIAQVARALHWFNPLAWFALRNLRVEQERACDDYVLRGGVKPSDYAGHVLELATQFQPAPRAASVALAMADRTRIEGRLHMILDAARDRRSVSRWLVVVTVLVAGSAAVSLAMLHAADERYGDATVDNAIAGFGDTDQEVLAAFNELVTRKDWRERTAASKKLAGLGRRALPTLLDGAKHSDDEVREYCYRVLWDNFPTEPAAIDTFIRGLKDEGESATAARIRYSCAFHLGSHKIMQAADALRDEYKSNKNLRLTAAKSLAELGHADVIVVLYDHLGSDHYMERYQANLGIKALTGKDLNDFTDYDWSEGAFVSGGREYKTAGRRLEDAEIKSNRFRAIAEFHKWLIQEKPKLAAILDPDEQRESPPSDNAASQTGQSRPESRGAENRDSPAATPPASATPKDKSVQELFKIWQAAARSDGKIPGGLIGQLRAKVEEFVRNNQNDISGAPYAKKVEPILPRFHANHDWLPDLALGLLNDLAALSTIPIETTLWADAERRIQSGHPLPAELKDAPWGEPTAEGLRAARPLDPQAKSYPVGMALRSRILLHNDGKEPVLLRTESFMQPGYAARDAKGNSLEVVSTYWTTLARVLTWRLAPGEFVEIATPGLGVGKGAGKDEWADVRVGSWIDVADGVDVTLSPGSIDIDVHMFHGNIPASRPANGRELKLAIIRERLELERPLPASAADRELIVRRVTQDIFGGEPTPDEISAFVTDKSDDPFNALAGRLFRRAGLAAFTGELKPDEITFRTAPADPDAANRPKVAIGPGRYTLDDNVRLIIVGKPVAGRRTSDVEIRFWAADQKSEPPGPPYKIQVPDGFGTWAITCRPRAGILWVLTQGAVRKIDYSNPAAVKETSITRGSRDDMPDEFREAVKRILTISNVPAEQITAFLAGSAPD